MQFFFSNRTVTAGYIYYNFSCDFSWNWLMTFMWSFITCNTFVKPIGNMSWRGVWKQAFFLLWSLQKGANELRKTWERDAAEVPAYRTVVCALFINKSHLPISEDDKPIVSPSHPAETLTSTVYRTHHTAGFIPLAGECYLIFFTHV